MHILHHYEEQLMIADALEEGQVFGKTDNFRDDVRQQLIDSFESPMEVGRLELSDRYQAVSFFDSLTDAQFMTLMRDMGRTDGGVDDDDQFYAFIKWGRQRKKEEPKEHDDAELEEEQ